MKQINLKVKELMDLAHVDEEFATEMYKRQLVDTIHKYINVFFGNLYKDMKSMTVNDIEETTIALKFFFKINVIYKEKETNPYDDYMNMKMGINIQKPPNPLENASY